MSDPTNTDAATVNTDAQTTDTAANTTADGAGDFEYPDGSKPPVDPETGLPILEDRSADFPDEAAEATEYVAEPVIETRDGRLHRLGTGSGLVGYRGLAAKRAEKATPVEPESGEQGQEPGQEATGEPGGDDDPSTGENGDETGTQGSGEEEDGAGDSEAGDDSEDDEPETPDETPGDEGYEPGEHTVDEVQAYLSEHPDQAQYVLDRERTGKARKTLIGA